MRKRMRKKSSWKKQSCSWKWFLNPRVGWRTPLPAPWRRAVGGWIGPSFFTASVHSIGDGFRRREEEFEGRSESF